VELQSQEAPSATPKSYSRSIRASSITRRVAASDLNMADCEIVGMARHNLNQHASLFESVADKQQAGLHALRIHNGFSSDVGKELNLVLTLVSENAWLCALIELSSCQTIRQHRYASRSACITGTRTVLPIIAREHLPQSSARQHHLRFSGYFHLER
jgi:hypothetical protein